MNPAIKNVLYFLSRNPKYSLTAAVVFIAVIVALFSTSGGEERAEELWADVIRGDFVDELVESGEIQAVDAQFVSVPRIWNMEFQIVSMAPEGSLVKAGDFLVQFDTSTLHEELDAAIEVMKQAEADLKSIETQQASTISELESNLTIAELSREAAKLKLELLKFESKNTQEEARLDHEKELIRYDETMKKIGNQKIIHRAEYMKSELIYEQRKEKVEEIKRQIESLTLVAPIDGMVVYQEIGGNGPDNPQHKPTVGDKVSPGRAVMGIPDMTKMKMIMQVNEMDASRLARGQNVTMSLDAFQNTEYHGKIVTIASLVEKSNEYWRGAPKPPSFDVTVLIDESDIMLKPGMTAQGIIETGRDKDVLIIPIGSIFELDDGSTVVFTKKSHPKPVEVKIVKRNDLFAVVKDGLRAGDKVAWHAPDSSYHFLGWYDEMERRRTEHQELVGHIDTMNERGITYNPAQADTSALKSTEPSKEAVKVVN